MTSLLQLETELGRLFSVGSQRKKSPLWPMGLPSRFSVYQNTVHANAFDTMNSDFPLTRKQFRPSTWRAVVDDFLLKNPPQTWELNECVFSFPDYLKNHNHPSLVVDLARYELADLRTFIHRADVGSRPGTNPTLSIEVFSWRLFDWTSEGAVPRKKPPHQHEVLIFFRDRSLVCHVRRADPLALLVLEEYQRQAPNVKRLERRRRRLMPTNRIRIDKVVTALKSVDLIF